MINRAINNLAILPMLFLAACAPSPSLSTDPGVLWALQQETGIEVLTLDDLCIQRPPNFEGVIVVGFLVPDLGCSGNELFVDEEYGSLGRLTPTALAAHGWEQEDQRETLALAWVREALFAWEIVVEEAAPEFATAGVPFSPPLTQRLGEGVQVTVWYRGQPGMSPEPQYFQAVVVFSGGGQLQSVEVVNSFTVPFEP